LTPSAFPLGSGEDPNGSISGEQTVIRPKFPPSKDGYRAGGDDGKMGMSMVDERHEGYDSRFEPYFARGYEAGWKANR
jgi:hypothetical protein